MHELVRKLTDIQEAEGLSDRGFASKLGLSNGQWSGVKSGTHNMGRKTLRAILDFYPGLKTDVNNYWLAQLRTPAHNSQPVAANA